MRKILIFLVFFIGILSFGELKDGKYIIREKVSTSGFSFNEKILSCDNILSGSIMEKHQCGELKILENGKSSFLELIEFFDSGNFSGLTTGKYLVKLEKVENDSYYTKNDLIEFYIKKINDNELEINIVKRISSFTSLHPKDFPVNRIVPNEKIIFKYDKNLENIDIKASKQLSDSFNEIIENYGINYGDYKKMKNDVYFGPEKINADYNTFEVFTFLHYSYYPGYTLFAKDKNNIYYKGKVWNGADYETFEIIYNYYVKDKDHIFFEDKIVYGADLKTFEIINDYYAKDKNSVYLKGEKVKNANPKTFDLKKLK